MSITLAEIRARKELRRKELSLALEKIREQLAVLGALRVMVFGSFASGEVISTSDLDVLAVMPPTKTGKEWPRKISETIDREVSLDILAFTEDELEKAIPVSSFLRRVLETGKVIYEKKSEG
ncbi:MAG: nucleotidyltransferase domain-containing protein [Candidatus Latescibacter sp.]|nr:nucleotidyltransferase domain-containing protein [Candidatus Latescibacter sp.]